MENFTAELLDEIRTLLYTLEMRSGPLEREIESLRRKGIAAKMAWIVSECDHLLYIARNLPVGTESEYLAKV